MARPSKDWPAIVAQVDSAHCRTWEEVAAIVEVEVSSINQTYYRSKGVRLWCVSCGKRRATERDAGGRNGGERRLCSQCKGKRRNPN